MTRPLALALLALVPTTAVAQGFALRPPPTLGDALDQVERMVHREEEAGARVRGGSGDELHQTFVLPERPGQNLVSWYGFRWRQLDADAPGGGGGIRLYYYESEREQARYALPAIRSAYARLVEIFHYTPTKRIPYILYATQLEFQTTNVFEVTESVLGVTSPQDLKMTVPYFGDHARFVEVSTHEMVHQFTIQKLMEASGGEDASSPINVLPLWYIEGIAEYYSKGGMDVETDQFLRDLVWNPDPSHHYEVVAFGEDRIRGYIPTYKMGQARIAFIAETYGREKIQAFLENAYLLGSGLGGTGGRNFGALVRRVLGEPIEQVDVRWRSWLKHRYYPAYLVAKQDLAQAPEVRNLPAEPEAFETSPDGQLLLFRGIDRERGRARVYLVDPRFPRSAVEIASDDVPGIESLHPIEQGILAIGDGVFAFSAQDGVGDRLYLHRYRFTPASEGKPSKLAVGRRHVLEVTTPEGGRFIQISDPTFSTDGSYLAFVGVASDGRQDIYVVPSTGGTARRVTNDPYAERDLFWGPDGIYCASDATDHGRLNLFRIDPGTGARTQLTTAPANDRHPRLQADGSVLFSSDRDGKPDLYLLKDGAVQRLSDFTTGLSSPGVAPKARGVYASTFYGGRFRVVELPKAAWLEETPVKVAAAADGPLPIPAEDFPQASTPYEALALRNWRPEAGIVYGGGAGNAIAGRAAVLFSDYLRDHVLYLDLAVYGSFDYTQALVLFEDRSRRAPLAFGAEHFVQQQIDRLDVNLAYYQRDFGAVGAIRYPLDRFQRVEGELTLGGVERYCPTDFSGTATLVCGGIQTSGGPYANTADWRRRNGGVNPAISPTVRYGYDTVRFDFLAGPIDGFSAVVELGGQYLPTRSAVTGFFRFDLQRYWRLIGRSKFELRAAFGTAFSPGGVSTTWERSFWLTSADNLRGYSPYDIAYLVGTHYYVTNAELQIPLDPLIHFFIFDYVAGVAAIDFGGVSNTLQSRPLPSGLVQPGLWASRTLTGVLGINMLFGPLLLRVHFGHPWDIGGIRTPALIQNTHWVTNITLRYFFF